VHKYLRLTRMFCSMKHFRQQYLALSLVSMQYREENMSQLPSVADSNLCTIRTKCYLIKRNTHSYNTAEFLVATNHDISNRLHTDRQSSVMKIAKYFKKSSWTQGCTHRRQQSMFACWRAKSPGWMSRRRLSRCLPRTCRRRPPAAAAVLRHLEAGSRWRTDGRRPARRPSGWCQPSVQKVSSLMWSATSHRARSAERRGSTYVPCPPPCSARFYTHDNVTDLLWICRATNRPPIGLIETYIIT